MRTGSGIQRTYKYDKKGNEAAVKVVSVGAIIIMDTYICKYDWRGNKISKMDYEFKTAIRELALEYTCRD